MFHVSGSCATAIVIGAILFLCCQMALGQGTSPAQVSEDDANFTLSNGIVTARIAKGTGELHSLQYKDKETLFQQPNRVGASWSQNASRGTNIAARITIDPKTNNGERAEVSVKGIAPNNISSDIEFRYSVGRGESGLYFYVVFDHPAEYPALGMPESRWVARLDMDFNWTQLDNDQLMREVPLDINGHQYLFAGSPFEQRAYGWASPARGVGVWLVNASSEFWGGGATKTDFLTHRDNPPADPFAPCILYFWKASHFGGGGVNVAQGEKWSKVIGPMFLYCNTGANPIAMLKDAQEQAKRETAKWPYDWVKGIDYTPRNQRTTVKGQIVLSDPLAPGAKMSKVLVGLAHPSAAGGGGRGRGGGGAGQVSWTGDAKFYQFWEHGQDDGNFSIANVPAGAYTLYAVADGVLGNFAKTDITVEAGKPLDLGKLTWTPVRHGKQIWEIGIPNRTAKEFTYGDKYSDPAAPLVYPKMFPNDVTFTIGKSDIRKDWFYEHIPHAVDDSGRLNGNVGVTGNGRATPYAIHFDMPAAPKGKATLRLAICGTKGQRIDVTLNDKSVGNVQLAGDDNTIVRHGIQGNCYERELAFDATMMKQGENVLILTIPAGPTNNGVIYDYLRLELDEAGRVEAAQ